MTSSWELSSADDLDYTTGRLGTSPSSRHDSSDGLPIRRPARRKSRVGSRRPERVFHPPIYTYLDDRQADPDSQDSNVTVHLELDGTIDINDELEHLAKLNRLGHFNEAIALFKERLEPHVDLFPVVAEYADLLLEQGNFGELCQFVSSRLPENHEKVAYEEYVLLELLKRLSEIYIRGAVLPALEMTLQALKFLEKKSKMYPLYFRPPSGVQIQSIDACLRIIAYAATHSSFLENDIFKPLLQLRFSNDRLSLKNETPDISSAQSSYPRIGDWYRLLVQEGFLWESHRVLRSMLPLLRNAHGQYMPNSSLEEFAQLGDLSKATATFIHREEKSNINHQLLLTNIANASLLASFLATNSSDERIQSLQALLSEEARSLASTMLLKHTQLVKSRPYLDWLLQQNIKGATVERKIHQQGLASGKWTHETSESQVQFLKQTTPNSLRQAGLVDNDMARQQNLDIVLASARDIGDYGLQQIVLRKYCQIARDLEKSLHIMQDLSVLCNEIMYDSAGYLQCLIDKYILLDSVGAPDTERLPLYMDLHQHLSDFDTSFPSHFNYDTSARQGFAFSFFDNPLLEWMKRRVLSRILSSIGREKEARLAGLQLPGVETHLPRYASLLNTSTLCLWCEYCSDTGQRKIPPEKSTGTRILVTPFARGPSTGASGFPLSTPQAPAPSASAPPRPRVSHAISNESYLPSIGIDAAITGRETALAELASAVAQRDAAFADRDAAVNALKTQDQGIEEKRRPTRRDTGTNTDGQEH